MKIFVISLLRSIERRANVTKQLQEAGLAFEFIDGVDGQALSAEFIRDNVNQERYNFWHELRHPGAIGCALSHRAAYQRMVTDNIPAAVILEDDIVLSPYFAQVLPQLETQLRQEEIILLFFQSSQEIGLSLSQKAELLAKYKLYEIKEFTYFGAAVGYVLSLSTAKGLMQVQQPIYTIADDWSQFHRLGAVKSFRLVLPFLVESAGFKSVIGYVDTKSLWGKLAGLVDKYRIFPFEQILRLTRKRSLRKRQNYTIKN
jgi:glycosyl transferase family 25